MAASASSSIQRSFKYDVFISFRGTDIRNTFLSHLYLALKEKGIYTYKDDERTPKGKRISDELLRSIEDSQFYIVVFSKNYASSSWCLDELVKIMECHKITKHTAFPVFFDVEPTEVRHQTGVVGEAFSIHENSEAAGRWRNALKEAADLAGWELKNTTDGDEARFIGKIIKDISLQLYSDNFSFDKKLVGIEARVHDIVSSLEIGIDDVRMIGIKGMGGAGKTTLARAVFDKISIQFEGKSFVENVREVTSNPSSGLKSLQQQILYDVLNEDVRVSGVGDGKNMLKRRLCGIKVLIALDDVDDITQLEALAGGSEWFKSGSRILITTRDEQVLLAHGVTLIRDVNLLLNIEAICLFSKYAFGREGPVQGYEKLSEQVVRYASGLPLMIKVLGPLFFGKSKPEWEDAIQRLKTNPLKRTLKILELSYTALEDDQKEIFLDIACIMKGWQKDKVIKVFESCGFRAKIGLRVLQQKSLITIYKDSFFGECVGMHDLIEETGRDIVRRFHPDMPHKHSRLWKHDEIYHILANDLGTEETRCIRLYSWNVHPYLFMECLGKMKSLRYLEVFSGDHFGRLDPDSFRPSLPDALRYLEWLCCPLSSLPKTFPANNLVTLEMPNSNIVELWKGWKNKVLEKLRFLDLSESKLRTLDLRLTPNLETLNLRGCCDLVELPDGRWTLKYLRSFKLNGCVLLEKLPVGLCRSGCLEDLDLSTTNIKQLPDGIWMLKHLKYLNLNGCKLLEKLPTALGHLACLEKLYLSYTKIKHLPDSICKLKHLNHLNLGGCLLLEKLPEDVGKLECLQELYLECTSISHLPQSILLLKGLEIYGPRGVLQSVGFTSAIETIGVQDKDEDEFDLCCLEV